MKPPIPAIGLEYVAEAEDWDSTNQMLVDAIQKGHCGAYWDILRKILQ